MLGTAKYMRFSKSITFDMTSMKLERMYVTITLKSYVPRHTGMRPDHSRVDKHTRVSDPDRRKPGSQL